MALQFSTIIDLTNAGVCAYLVLRLHRAANQDSSSQTVKNFLYTYGSLTAAYVLLFMPRIIAGDQTAILGYSFAIGNFFFLLACGFLGKIMVFFSKPAWVKRYFVTFLVLTGIGLVRSVYEPARPVVDSTTGITNWNVDLASGIYFGILMLAILIPGVIFFIKRGIQAKDNHIVRVRSLTVGVGILLMIFSAVIFYLAASETVAIIGDLFSIGALLTVFLGVIYHRPQFLPYPVVQPNSNNQQK